MVAFVTLPKFYRDEKSKKHMISEEKMHYDNRNMKRALTIVAGLVLLVVLLLAGMTYGIVEVSIKEFLAGTLPADTKRIIGNIRMPRVIVGALVGMNLALAGSIMQGVLRNPLASPSTLGVTGGAGLGAMFILILYPHLMNFVPLTAFCGAMVSMLLVYMLSWQGGQVQPMRLILSGVALTALFTAAITSLMVFHADKVQGAIQWMAGGFQGRSWQHVRMVLPYTVAGFGLSIWSAKTLNILSLGDDMATSLGVNVPRSRLILMTIASFLTASAVSAAGTLSFVGLIVPHIARLLVGSDYETMLPAAAIFGAALIVGADTVARLVLQPAEVPVGVFMAFLGAPFFLYLLRQRGGIR